MKKLIIATALFLGALVQQTHSTQLSDDSSSESAQQKALFNEFESKQLINFDDLKANITKLFYSDQCIDAFNLLDEFDLALAEDRLEFGVDSTSGEVCANMQVDEFLQQEMVQKLVKDRGIMRQYLAELKKIENKQMDGWTMQMDEPNKKIYYKLEEGYNYITQYIEVSADVNYMQLVNLFAEISMMKQWIPFVSVSEELGAVSPYRSFVHVIGDAFWPMASRENFIEFNVLHLKEEKAFGIPFSTVKESSWFGTPIQKQKDTVFMEFHKAFFLLKPVSEKKTLLRIIVNADPNFEYVPSSVLNFGMKYVVPKIIEYVVSSSKSLPKVFLDQIPRRKEFYEGFRSVGDKFLEENIKESELLKSQQKQSRKRTRKGREDL